MHVRALLAAALSVGLLGQADAAAPSSTAVRTLADVPGPVLTLAQDRGRIAWLGPPEYRPRVEILEVATGERSRLPSRAPSESWDIAMPSLALAGNRVVYVRGDAWGNTGLAYSILTTTLDDRRERVVFTDESISRPAVRERFPWPMAADGNTIVFAANLGLRALVDGRPRRVPGPRRNFVSMAGATYATSWVRTLGGCICNLSPSWAPDGKRLTYASGLRLGLWNEASQPPNRVHVVQADGTNDRVVARGLNPDWSPDGSLIAYERRQGAAAIYVVRPDGTEARRLVAGSDPDWSPDGRRIAFSRNGAIFVADRDGTRVRRVATVGFGPNWSPDGRRLAFVGAGSGIYVVNADGSRRGKLTSVGDGATEPRWLPDGRTIAYTITEADDFTETVTSTRVRLVNLDSGGTNVLRLLRKGLTASWSPDGRRVAFAGWLSDVHPTRGNPSTEIFIAGAAGGGDRRVTTTRVSEPTSAGMVRQIGTGSQAIHLRFGGAVLAIAHTPRTVAVLVKGFSGKRVVLLDARTGRRVRRIPAATNTAPRLSAAGHRVVLAAGKSILLIDARSGRITTIARASVAPLGLSIEGRRVAWVENVRGRALIRALSVQK